MSTLADKLVYWAPRVLSILFALFISLFALDVFSETRGFWETTGALLMHLIPTFFILIVLFVSWRREWIAAILYAALAVLYVVGMWGKFPLATYLAIAGPLVLTAALFMLSWHQRGHLAGNPAARS